MNDFLVSAKSCIKHRITYRIFKRIFSRIELNKEIYSGGVSSEIISNMCIGEILKPPFFDGRGIQSDWVQFLYNVVRTNHQ